MVPIEHSRSFRPSLVVALTCTGLLLLLLTGCEVEADRRLRETATAQVAADAANGTDTDTAATTTPTVEPTPADQPTPTTEPTATAEPTPTLTPTPRIPQGGVLTMRRASDVSDLQPWDLRSRDEELIADLLYNGLVRLDAQRRPQPDLAEDWEVSPDGAVITFTLRSDVTWHDGQPLTGEDVTWTYNLLRTMTPTNALLFDLRSTIEEVRLPQANTVVFSLTAPHAPLLAKLATPILPRHRLGARSPDQIAARNFWELPVGTGPFRFDRRQEDQTLIFRRNDTYFRGAPNLEQVLLQLIPDPAIAAEAVAAEQVLLAEFADAPQTFSDSVPTAVERGTYPENGWYGLVFNMRSDRLFADRRLREVLAHAVDVPALVQTVTGGVGEPLTTPLLPDTWAYPDELAPQSPDLAEANRLLDEAGWTIGPDGIRQQNGQPLAARIWVRNDDPRRIAAATLLAEAARQIGMQLAVEPANFDTVILAKLAPSYDFDLLLGSWVNAPNTAGFATNRFYDPDDYALFHSSRVWRGEGDTRTALRNISGFSDEAYDQLAEEARRTYDVEERAEIIAAAQAVIVRERPYLFLWTDQMPVVLNTRIHSEDGAIDLNTPFYLRNVEEWYIER